MKRQVRRVEHCQNCGHNVIENYCSWCGQKNVDTTLTFDDLLRDAADQFLQFDSKLVATLRPLLFRPGFLTTEYLVGRRASYITPLRLYFIISALYFLAYAFARTDTLIKVQLDALFHSHVHVSMTGIAMEPHQHAEGPGAGAHHDEEEAAALHASYHHAIDWFVAHGSTVAICSLPFAALVLQGLYFRQKRLYAEHLIFTVHVLSFHMLVLLPTTLAHGPPMIWLLYALLLVSAVYIFLAMRAVYRQSRLQTLVKTGLYLIGYVLISELFLAGAVLAYRYL